MDKNIESESRLVFLDACCLINLFATDRTEEILRALPYDFAVAEYVMQEEVLEIRSDGEASSASSESRESLQAPIARLVDKGLLTEVALSSAAELGELVRFAAQLDDGEAHTCALASVRGARVATDDRKAIRVLRSAWEERQQGLEVLRTSDLLFAWAEANEISESDLARVVADVVRRARFFPPKDDPWFSRWMELLRRERQEG